MEYLQMFIFLCPQIFFQGFRCGFFQKDLFETFSKVLLWKFPETGIAQKFYNFFFRKSCMYFFSNFIRIFLNSLWVSIQNPTEFSSEAFRQDLKINIFGNILFSVGFFSLKFFVGLFRNQSYYSSINFPKSSITIYSMNSLKEMCNRKLTEHFSLIPSEIEKKNRKFFQRIPSKNI